MNKTIWMCWFQGWKNAPEIAEHCLKSWKHYNSDWDIVLLNEKNYKDYITIDEDLFGLKTNYISLGDIIRLYLLREYGGVWADATTFCNKPVDWVTEYPDSFIFTRKDKMIASWFIFAQDESYIIDVWHKKMVEYWQHRMEHTDTFEQQYGWIHALFRRCYSEDKKFRTIIDSMHKIDCTSDGNGRGNGPHFFAPYRKYFYNPISDEVKNRIDAKIDPLYKLSYKANTDWRSPENRGIHPSDQKIKLDYPSNSELYYLLNTL